MGGIGGGLTYYFMPINIYLTGSLLFAFGAAAAEGANLDPSLEVSLHAGTGYAAELTLGKEWWVVRGIGLGVALQLMHASFGSDPTAIAGTSVQLLLSATVN
jgi:hypothetical protein